MPLVRYATAIVCRHLVIFPPWAEDKLFSRAYHAIIIIIIIIIRMLLYLVHLSLLVQHLTRRGQNVVMISLGQLID